MPIRPRLLPAIGLWLLAAAVLPASAQSPDPTTDPGDPPGQTRFEPTRGRGSAFASSLREAELAHEAALAELRARLDAAPRAERPALQREIEALKRQREARLVRVQLADARRRGRAELATRLEQRLARLAAAGVHAPETRGGAR